MAERSTTPRGFAVYDTFKDSRDQLVSLQLSSAAMICGPDGDDSGPFVWVFCTDGKGRSSDTPPPAPHLNVEQARRLRDALAAFIREHRR